MDFEKELDLLKLQDKIRRRTSRQKKNNKEHEKSEIEFQKIQDRYFDTIKNLTILSGTVFASSIALATGKAVNNYFLSGELLLLIATLFGAMFIWSAVRSREVSYFWNVKWRMESDLLLNKDLVEDFEKEQTEKLIAEYDRLANKKSALYFILRCVKVDWLPTLFFVSFTIGLLLIWFSLTSQTNLPVTNNGFYGRFNGVRHFNFR